MITFDTPLAYLREIAAWWCLGLLIGYGLGWHLRGFFRGGKK